MTTPKNRGQTDNLRRGTQKSKTETKRSRAEHLEQYRFQPGVAQNPKGNVAALQAAHAREKEIRAIASDDPERIQEELYKELSVAALRLTKKMNRQSGEPSKVLIDAWREVRQAGLVVLDIRRTRGAMAEAEEFFTTMDGRIGSLNDNLDSISYPIMDMPGSTPAVAAETVPEE
jgi:hypothetical protein